MPYRELTLEPPFSVLAGDRFPVDRSTSTIYQLRGAVIVDSRVVSFPGALIGETPAAESDGVFGRILVWEEKKVPGVTVSCTGVSRDTTTGIIYFNFSDDSQEEVSSLETLSVLADSVDAEMTIAKKFIKALIFRMSPDATNLGEGVGYQVSVNCAPGAEPLVFTPGA
jgi:hypothetical protein